MIGRIGAHNSAYGRPDSAVYNAALRAQSLRPCIGGQAALDSNAMKILVVDDHSLITDALSVLFLDLDPTAEVITTRTAEGALKIQEEQPSSIWSCWILACLSVRHGAAGSHGREGT